MKEESELGFLRYGDDAETKRRGRMVELLKETPIPEDELLYNLGLYLVPQTLSRILFMDFLYRQALEVQGVVFDFGCRWGQNASLFSAMRGIYEPFNRLRKVIAIDTFEGFPGITEKDGTAMKAGGYSVPAGYEGYLEDILRFQEQESPLPHVKKFEVIKGDASSAVAGYLKRHPETIVSLAYFDFDIYQPTRDCLELIRPHITRGTVLGFDELVEPACPGETLALREILGLDRYAVKRSPHNARSSYLIVDG